MVFLKPYIFAACILLLFSSLAKAQEDTCAKKLQQAKQLFAAGQIEQIPELLDSCLNTGFSKQQKIEAYRLLIQTYLFDSDRETADSIMHSMLTQYPDYKIKSSDPVEFTELFNSYAVVPHWAIGIKAGSNLPQIMVKENYSLSNLNKLSSNYSSNGTNVNGGLFVDWYLKRNMWLSASVEYSKLQFQKTENVGYGTEQSLSIEKTQWFSFPVILNYSFTQNKIKPFLHLGMAFDYLSSATSDIRLDNMGGGKAPAIISSTSVNLSNSRNPFNLAALGGIGITYSKGFGMLQVMLGYRYSLLPYVKGNQRYANHDLVYYYQHIDDDFRINNFYISIGYAHIFFKIKKKQVNEP